MEHRLYCVYKHVAPWPDNRIYIGKTCQNLLQRWRRGYNQNMIFQSAIDEFGDVVDEFTHYVLDANGKDWTLWDRSMAREETHHFSLEEADELEGIWISISDSLDFHHGFNRQSGGDKGYVMSKDYIEYVSETRKGRYKGEKNPFYGKTHSDEVKIMLSEQAKQRTGEKNPFKGKHHTEEAKERNRQAHLGKYDGTKNPFYGKSHSDETKRILAERQRKPVAQYDIEGNLIAEFLSASDAAKAVGVSVQAISDNCRKKTRRCAGYIFRYV